MGPETKTIKVCPQGHWTAELVGQVKIDDLFCCYYCCYTIHMFTAPYVLFANYVTTGNGLKMASTAAYNL